MTKQEFVRLALAEDVGRGDLFERTIEDGGFSAVIVSKSNGVFAGETYGQALLDMSGVTYDFFAKDGKEISVGDKLLGIEGNRLEILTMERTLLNMLQHASGIATKARIFARLGETYGVKVLDTRKTRPLLRVFEKYAARVGGVTNHRLGLDDALMIKDTHLKAIDNLEEYIKNARKVLPFTAKIEVECESVDAAKDAIRLGVDIVMCDNMSPQAVAEVVLYKKSTDSKILVECSGNINVDNFALYAKSGIDAVSIGSIIHQAVWLDFSMKGVLW